MDIRQLKYIMTVAECRSVSRAAEKLYISQSALSHYIKGAEKEIGAELFDRSTSPISLTHAGELYIDSAKKILLETDSLERKIRDVNNHMTGKLVIGTSRDRASYIAPFVIPCFKEMYPNIDVSIHTEGGKELMKDLREGKVDFAILPESQGEDERGVAYMELYSEEVFITAKPGHIAPEHIGGDHDYIKFGALDKYSYITLGHGRVTRTYMDQLFSRNGFDLKIAMEMDSNIGCYRMSSTGLGIALVPIQTISMSRSDFPVEILRIGENGALWAVRCYYRKGAYLGRPELDLLDIVRTKLSEVVDKTISDKSYRMR